VSWQPQHQRLVNQLALPCLAASASAVAACDVAARLPQAAKHGAARRRQAVAAAAARAHPLQDELGVRPRDADDGDASAHARPRGERKDGVRLERRRLQPIQRGA